MGQFKFQQVKRSVVSHLETHDVDAHGLQKMPKLLGQSLLLAQHGWWDDFSMMV